MHTGSLADRNWWNACRLIALVFDGIVCGSSNSTVHGWRGPQNGPPFPPLFASVHRCLTCSLSLFSISADALSAPVTSSTRFALSPAFPFAAASTASVGSSLMLRHLGGLTSRLIVCTVAIVPTVKADTLGSVTWGSA